MAKLHIKGSELRALGYPESPVISIAMQIVGKQFKHSSREEVMNLLKQLLQEPEQYKEDPVLAPIAHWLLPDEKDVAREIALYKIGVPFSVYGNRYIDESALHQMHQAVKLPVSVRGALMPDAHSGYGLPIGGVLATEGAVIPYAVGVDIGCRMCLSVFDLPVSDLKAKHSFFTNVLMESTLFGSGAQFQQPHDHVIMEQDAFDEIPLLKGLQGKAWKQLGSSGSGNHFAEFGIVNIPNHDPVLGIEAGTYIGLLTHSGSRGLGASIAGYYTKLAKEQCKLPGEAAALAWLDLGTEVGMEYWIAMNLAGEYASACHHIIHRKLAKQLGRKPIKMVENHHNFAWKEMHEGKEWIVHRKGATPAGADVLGIIPGSMTANGYIVKGKGVPESICSASHGAGRKMSRRKAMESITHSALKQVLKKHEVTLIGGGLDEAPFAYKDIDEVMKSQEDLVDILGSFMPKIVRMDGSDNISR